MFSNLSLLISRQNKLGSKRKTKLGYQIYRPSSLSHTDSLFLPGCSFLLSESYSIEILSLQLPQLSPPSAELLTLTLMSRGSCAVHTESRVVWKRDLRNPQVFGSSQ